MKVQKTVFSMVMVVVFCFGSVPYGHGTGFGDLNQTANHTVSNRLEGTSDNEILKVLIQQVASLQQQVSLLQAQVLRLSTEKKDCSNTIDEKLEETLNARLNAQGDLHMSVYGPCVQKTWLKPVWGLPTENWASYYLPATVYYQYKKEGKLVTESIIVEADISLSEFKRLGGVETK